MKAIETSYKGYRFRSRLEARWAVFFDALGIKWEYEKEGYELKDDDGTRYHYLPDFWLPGIGFFEVKGQELNHDERTQCYLLALRSMEIVYTAEGAGPFDNVDIGGGVWLGTFRPFPPEKDTNYEVYVDEYNACFIRCSKCEEISIAVRDVDCRCGDLDEQSGDSRDKLILDAVRKFRSARFEFGEVPR